MSRNDIRTGINNIRYLLSAIHHYGGYCWNSYVEKENKMKCPMQKIVVGKDSEGNNLTDFRGCLEEECAWWYGAHSCCSMPALVNSLEELRFTIQRSY